MIVASLLREACFISMTNSLKNYTYREASDRLREIIASIEQQNNADIDDLIKLTEEAIELIAFCRKRLTETDEKVSSLLEKLSETEETLPSEHEEKNNALPT